MSAIAVIPARSGSKRLPHKNIRDFRGAPIIKYSIEAALASDCFDEVMVSTDASPIAIIAKEYGAAVPFLRSAAASTDHATLADAVEEVILRYREAQRSFDYICCLLPTAPLVSQNRILEGYRLLIDSGADSVFPIVRFGYPVQRGLRKRDGRVEMIWPENYSARSQDLEPVFHDSGQFYWVRTPIFLQEKRFFLPQSAYIELSEMEVHDIDTPEDWRFAELKYDLLKKGKNNGL